jgi:predicted transcriptional regulator
LLIDGRRSVADLVRLTRRDDDEVQAVLVHLINLGLIE